MFRALWRYLCRKQRLNDRMRDFERCGMHYVPGRRW